MDKDYKRDSREVENKKAPESRTFGDMMFNKLKAKAKLDRELQATRSTIHEMYKFLEQYKKVLSGQVKVDPLRSYLGRYYRDTDDKLPRLMATIKNGSKYDMQKITKILADHREKVSKEFERIKASADHHLRRINASESAEGVQGHMEKLCAELNKHTQAFSKEFRKSLEELQEYTEFIAHKRTGHRDERRDLLDGQLQEMKLWFEEEANKGPLSREGSLYKACQDDLKEAEEAREGVLQDYGRFSLHRAIKRENLGLSRSNEEASKLRDNSEFRYWKAIRELEKKKSVHEKNREDVGAFFDKETPDLESDFGEFYYQASKAIKISKLCAHQMQKIPEGDRSGEASKLIADGEKYLKEAKEMMEKLYRGKVEKEDANSAIDLLREKSIKQVEFLRNRAKELSELSEPVQKIVEFCRSYKDDLKKLKGLNQSEEDTVLESFRGKLYYFLGISGFEREDCIDYLEKIDQEYSEIYSEINSGHIIENREHIKNANNSIDGDKNDKGLQEVKSYMDALSSLEKLYIIHSQAEKYVKLTQEPDKGVGKSSGSPIPDSKSIVLSEDEINTFKSQIQKFYNQYLKKPDNPDLPVLNVLLRDQQYPQNLSLEQVLEGTKNIDDDIKDLTKTFQELKYKELCTQFDTILKHLGFSQPAEKLFQNWDSSSRDSLLLNVLEEQGLKPDIKRDLQRSYTDFVSKKSFSINDFERVDGHITGLSDLSNKLHQLAEFRADAAKQQKELLKTLGHKWNKIAKSYLALSDFDTDHIWRLSVPGDKQDENTTPENRNPFYSDPYYLVNTLSTLGLAFDHLGEELTADSLGELHDKGFEKSANPFKVAFEYAPGYRGLGMQLGFDIIKEVHYTDEGLEEICEKYACRKDTGHSHSYYGQDGHPVGDNCLKDPKEMFLTDQVYSTNTSPKEKCREDAARILKRYYKEIKECKNDDDKLTAIVTCCQDLYQAHLLNDGNTRTIALIVLNKLLIENHLQPTILKNPKIFTGFSVKQIKEHVRRGQKRWAFYKKRRRFYSLS